MTPDSSAESLTSPSSPTAAEARRAARNAGALAAASVISKGALFGWQLVLAPMLGPEAFGVYGTVGALFAIAVPVASFGMGPIIIRDVARHPERAGRYWSALLFMQTALALLAYIGINAAASALHYGATIQVYVAIAGLSLLIDMFGNMGNELLLAHERMLATSLVEVGHIALRLMLAGIALLAGYGLLGVYVATIASGIARWWTLWALLMRTRVSPHWPLDRTVARSLLVNGAPLALAAVLKLTYEHADKLMTTYFIGTEGTGYLTAAFVIIFGVVELLNTTVLVATFPVMSRYYGSAVMGFMVEKLAFFTALVIVPVCLVISLFSGTVIGLFGGAFRASAGVLAILIWYAAVMMAANVFAQGMMVQNRQRRLTAIRAGGLLVNLTLNAVMLPRYGIQGAAVSTVCAEILVFALIVASFQEDGLDRRRLAWQLARLAAAGAAVAALMWALGQLHWLVGVVVGLSAYLLIVLAGRLLAPDDWDLLYRLAAAMPGGAVVRRYWKRDTPINW